MLQCDVRNKSCEKRDLQSLQSNSMPTCETDDLAFSPRKKEPLFSDVNQHTPHEDLVSVTNVPNNKKLFSDESHASQESGISRPPLLPLDMNSQNIQTRWAAGSSNQLKKHARMMRAKAERKEKRGKGKVQMMAPNDIVYLL